MLLIVKLVYPELADIFPFSGGVLAGLKCDDSEMELINTWLAMVVVIVVDIAGNFVFVVQYSGCGDCSGLDTTFMSKSGSCEDIPANEICEFPPKIPNNYFYLRLNENRKVNDYYLWIEIILRFLWKLVLFDDT